MTRIKYIVSKDPRSKPFNDYIINNHPHLLIEKFPELIMVTGGDGAMLHAIQDNMQYNIPFFGHAAGTLNFLMNGFKNYDEIVLSIINGSLNLHTVTTTTIKVNVLSKNLQTKVIGYAVNDVVLGSNVMGYHDYLITSEDGSFDNFDIKGTGLCISTDLGSTGYNFNLGGPVLPLGSSFWAIEGIGCNRYLNDILAIENLSIRYNPTYGQISVFIDGINKECLDPGDVVTLSKGSSIKIAFLDKTDFIKKRVEITSRYRKS